MTIDAPHPNIVYGHPALLVGHVALTFSAYALFFGACVAGLAFLLQERSLKRRQLMVVPPAMPSLDWLEAFVHRMILWGWPLLTLGMALGMVWAKREWGRYWGWDPKETFAAITWLTYGVYLTVRHLWAWRGRKSIYFSLAGYAFVLITWVLVNAFSPLHKF